MKSRIRYQLIAAIPFVLALTLLPSTSAQNPKSVQGISEPFADLGVTKSAPDQANPGSDITYDITVINAGDDPAENATLNDSLPATLTFVSLSSPAGWSCTTPSVGAEGTVSCTNPSLAITEGDVFTLVVHVPTNATPGTFFSNTATVSTTTLDPNDENNSSTASTLVSGNSADLTVTKSVDTDEVMPGHPLTYTIQVINNGPDSADNATLNDTLPAEVYFLSLSQPGGWTCMTPEVGSGGGVSCSRPSLAVTTGDTFTLVVVVRSDTPETTVITNTATVGTSTPESSDENNSDTASATVLPADPTAADGSVGGRILDGYGNPVSGTVVQLSGLASRKTITDANGNYLFDSLDTGWFYTVTPARANFNFSPTNRSLTLVGNQTEAVFTGMSLGDHRNPLDTPEYFVRQQYLDLLGREPDEAGFNYWSDQILACGADVQCANLRRRDIAAAFFISEEFQASGSYIYDVYASTLGRRPVFGEYTNDRQQVVGGSTLDAAKVDFAQNFVQRAEFMTKYRNATTAESFVDAVLQSVQATGADLSGERANLIGIYDLNTDQVGSRAGVVKAIADNVTLRQSQYNRSFVLTEYYAYLRRDIDQGGYAFWLNVLNNREPGNYRGMVCAFVTSTEYQNRFSVIVSHHNGECGQ